ncbi:MAG: hypothetical protein WC749_09785 [Dehalococcoidia bacterium]
MFSRPLAGESQREGDCFAEFIPSVDSGQALSQAEGLAMTNNTTSRVKTFPIAGERLVVRTS